jgi:hypothetical protein
MLELLDADIDTDENESSFDEGYPAKSAAPLTMLPFFRRIVWKLVLLTAMAAAPVIAPRLSRRLREDLRGTIGGSASDVEGLALAAASCIDSLLPSEGRKEDKRPLILREGEEKGNDDDEDEGGYTVTFSSLL